jgi:hypothetical protein
LKLEKIDPRFHLVKRGSSKYVEWLGYKDNPNGAGWAWPGQGYGYDIVKILNKILGEPVTPKHWGDEYIAKLKEFKIIDDDHEGDAPVTWAELAKVTVETLSKIEKDLQLTKK